MGRIESEKLKKKDINLIISKVAHFHHLIIL